MNRGTARACECARSRAAGCSQACQLGRASTFWPTLGGTGAGLWASAFSRWYRARPCGAIFRRGFSKSSLGLNSRFARRKIFRRPRANRRPGAYRALEAQSATSGPPAAPLVFQASPNHGGREPQAWGDRRRLSKAIRTTQERADNRQAWRPSDDPAKPYAEPRRRATAMQAPRKQRANRRTPTLERLAIPESRAVHEAHPANPNAGALSAGGQPDTRPEASPWKRAPDSASSAVRPFRADHSGPARAGQPRRCAARARSSKAFGERLSGTPLRLPHTARCCGPAASAATRSQRVPGRGR
jgi:hypothetical protein